MAIFTIVLQSLLIAYYLFSGTAKMIGAKYWADMFEHLRLPQWFLKVTGLVQLAGAAVLIVGYWYTGLVAWAGVWLGVTMLVASLVHIRTKDPIGKTAPALFFAVLNVALILANAGQMLQPFA
ncbi:DoxX family protein [Paenibacillus cineris]|uniref:DoxX family protein n=1 Tax=Paenibacillus cineris TaxID=237530 RepID=UPI001AFEECF1|nr:DoxX family protein [Paenibacillus cineris]GIO64206.1 hypothetical protein J43TS9_57800 [Paenibacillus cineris]